MKKRSVRRVRRQRGFTLLEVLMVIIILGLLAAAVVPTFFRQQGAQEINITRLAITGSLKTALDMYRANMRRYPTSDEGLKALVEAPSDEQERAKWTGPYVDDPAKLKDAWGHEFKYDAPGQYNQEAYDLSSAGPDGAFGTGDDITNWVTTR